MQEINDINAHIANLAHQTNKVIAKYAQLEMCRIKNVVVEDDGHIDYLINPDALLKEKAKYKKKMELLLDEIKEATDARDQLMVDDE